MTNDKSTAAFFDNKLTEKFTQKAALYAQKHSVYGMFQDLLKELVLHQPKDPIEYMINCLERRPIKKIVVLGPPGSGKFTQVQKISRKYEMVVISAADMIAELAHENSDAKHAMSLLDEGEEVPNNIMTNVLLARLAMEDCQVRGWLLVGMPMDRHMALQLQKYGFLPDKVIYLNAVDDEMINRVEGRRIDSKFPKNSSYHIHHNVPTTEQIIDRLVPKDGDDPESMRRKLAAHNKDIAPVLECFESSLKHIDALKPIEEVFNDICIVIDGKLKTPAMVPHIPHRVILVGPPGVGKLIQVKNIVNRYGVVPVSAGELLRQAVVSRKGGKQQMKIIKEHIQNGKLVPDVYVNELVAQRIQQEDCRKYGFVLHGYPRTIEQAQAMMTLDVSPTHFIVFDAPDGLIMERLTMRRIDPVDNTEYHLRTNLPKDKEVLERLQQRKQDEEALVKQKLASFRSNIAAIQELFVDNLHHIDGALPLQLIWETVQSYIDGVAVTSFSKRMAGVQELGDMADKETKAIIGKIFDMYDEAGVGYLDTQALKKVLRDTCLDVTKAEEILHKLDYNHSGLIEKNEFLTWIITTQT